jgi:hypothetical protein
MIRNHTDWPAGRILRGSGIVWYLVAALGQAAFIWFIVAHYGGHTLAGNYPSWNDKPLIDGYLDGDHAGNVMFILHVLLASVTTLGGLLQLLPQLRRASPTFHRWNGRLLIALAVFMSLGGLWLVWVRGTRLSFISAIAVSTDAILILVFGSLTLYYAIIKRFHIHRRWAMRTFMVINGVWFLRVGYMAWAHLGNGIGSNGSLTGPADIVLAFGCYFIPVGILELYFMAQDSAFVKAKLGVAAIVTAATLVMVVGIHGTVTVMWLPVL